MNNGNEMNLKLLKTHVRSMETLVRKIHFPNKYPTLFSSRIKDFKVKLAELENDINHIKDDLRD